MIKLTDTDENSDFYPHYQFSLNDTVMFFTWINLYDDNRRFVNLTFVQDFKPHHFGTTTEYFLEI